MKNLRQNHEIKIPTEIPSPTPWTPPKLKPKKKGVVVDNKKYAEAQWSRQAYIRLMNDIDNGDLIDEVEKQNFIDKVAPIIGEYQKKRIARKQREKRNTIIITIAVILLAIWGLTH